MKILRFVISVILSICLVVFTVGSDLFGASMLSVTAVGPEVVLGLDVMYEICEYFGATFLSYSCGRSLPEVSNDELARLGHDFLKTTAYIIYETDASKPGVHADPTPYIGFVDSKGQSYVFGSEALKETAETEFTVIQGGKNDGDDDDDDNDNEDNIIHFPKKVAGAGKLAVALTTTTASTVASAIAYQYNKWVNGDEDNLLEPFFEQYPDVTASDIAKQQSGHIYSFNSSFARAPLKCNICDAQNITLVTSFSGDISKPLAFLYTPRSENQSSWHGGDYQCFSLNSADTAIQSYPVTYSGSCPSCGYVFNLSYTPYWTIAFSANVPIFSSYEAVQNYLQTGTGYKDAINYANEYRNADWLQDDWTGKLLDPLTGLNALSNWYNIARHQGLNALGDSPSVDDMGDYLRDYFAQNGTDILPEVDPTLAPIKYPSSLPDVVIDPARNPAISPVDNSGIDPSIPVNPDKPVNPDIPIDIPSDSVVDIPIEDIVPTVNDSFIDIAASLKYKFPFSIPWDVYGLLNIFAELGTRDSSAISTFHDDAFGAQLYENNIPVPKSSSDAPYFILPLVIESYGIEEYIIVDLKDFGTLSTLSRTLFSVLFAMYLINLTFKVVSMRKEE